MSSTKIACVLATLALLCFAALVALQVLELTHYSAPRSVWLSAS